MNSPADMQTTFPIQSPTRRIVCPIKITSVATIELLAVPNRQTSSPPTSGVQVLLRSNAAIMRENSALDVPISRERRDLRGPRKYDPLDVLSDMINPKRGLVSAHKCEPILKAIAHISAKLLIKNLRHLRSSGSFSATLSGLMRASSSRRSIGSSSELSELDESW